MNPPLRQRMAQRSDIWAILGQVLVLAALGLGLHFVLRTTGGTVFLFTALAPLLILAAMAIVAWLAIEAFRKRHHLFHRQVFKPGQVVFREGDAAACAYFIECGEVEVSRLHDGQDKVLARLGVGDYFGELSLLSDDPRRGATVRALTETHVAVVGKENFLRMLFTIPSVREDVLSTAHTRVRSDSALSG